MNTVRLTDEQIAALSDIINGTISSLPEDCTEEITFWIDTLRMIGCNDLADAWEQAA
jgi:hypothetical protein